MALQAIYDIKDKDKIPEQYLDLYSERDGKLELTGIIGIKTQADFERIQEGLRKEKNDHKETKAKLSDWNGLNMEYTDVASALDRIPELEAASKGNIDEDKMETIVQGRVKSQITPVERELAKVKDANTKLVEENESFKNKERYRIISDDLRTAATKLKVLPEAIDDLITLGERHFEITDDGKVMTKDDTTGIPGLASDEWLTDMREKRPYFWPASEGGGAGGGGSGNSYPNNPWSKDHWNLTAQGKVITEKGQETAERMAKSVGSSVGATKPAESKSS